jgi:hypothetical protein
MRGSSLMDRALCLPVDQDGHIRMGMDIDESGGYDLPVEINRLNRCGNDRLSHLLYSSIKQEDIKVLIASCYRIYNSSTFKQQLRHRRIAR